MKISIIIPVYNVSAYIERCIKSVINQSYKGDIECIIVDDATPDDSITLCERIINEYKGNIDFVIIHHDFNKGLSSSRNTGTSYATGDFIYYLDSDDEISDNCIELLVDEIEKHPDVEIVQGEVKSIPNKNYYEKEHLKDVHYINDNTWIQKHYFNPHKSLPVNAWNKLIKRHFLERNNIRFKDGIIHEDELWMFYVTKYLRKISFCHHKTYIHYITPGSIMTTTSNLKSAKNWSVILDDVSNNFTSPFHHLQFNYYYRIFANKYVLYSLLPEYKKLMKKYIGISLKRRYLKIYILLIFLYLSVTLNKGQYRVLNKINKL